MDNQMQEQMTIREVVGLIAEDLGKIEVRMSDMERYGFPIARAIQGLKEICKAWDEHEAMEAQEQVPEIEIVPMEETNNAET